jgi:CheY-like chemotaxis protein
MRFTPRMPSVFLVDDDADSRALTQRLLARAGILNPVVEAGSGEEAKQYLRRCCLAAGARRGAKPAVVLLDIKMPEVSGFDVLKWIRRRKAFRHTKIVMWSTSDDEDDYRRSHELRADGFLVKFPSPAVFGSMMRICLAESARKGRGACANRASPPVG